MNTQSTFFEQYFTLTSLILTPVLSLTITLFLALPPPVIALVVILIPASMAILFHFVVDSSPQFLLYGLTMTQTGCVHISSLFISKG